MDGITDMLAGLQENLLTLVIPISVIGLFLWFVAGALQPLLPDWAQSMRGYFQYLCLRIAIVGGATTLVTALYGLFGGGSGG